MTGIAISTVGEPATGRSHVSTGNSNLIGNQALKCIVFWIYAVLDAFLWLVFIKRDDSNKQQYGTSEVLKCCGFFLKVSGYRYSIAAVVFPLGQVFVVSQDFRLLPDSINNVNYTGSVISASWTRDLVVRCGRAGTDTALPQLFFRLGRCLLFFKISFYCQIV